MRRILPLSLLFITLLGGLAMADHDRGRRDRSGDRGWDRNRGGDRRVDRRSDRRVYRGPVRQNRRVYQRRPVYASNGQFVFSNGRRHRYVRPVFRQRYYNYRVRPQVYVEQVPQQDGYIWTQGSWSWNGGEWMWNAGYYAPDPSIQVYYDDGSWE
ncbi:MAG: hypothetical protein WKG01_04140 [Kofleriaceae bacterium]